MACALTQGFNLDCRDSKGGLKEIYFIEIDNLATITEVAGVITVLTKDTGKQFRKYSLIKNTSNVEEAIQANEANGTIFYQQTANVILNKLQTSVRNEILLLAQNRLVAVAVDYNGVGWMLGKENGLTLSGGSAATGTALADRNGYTLTFTGEEDSLAPSVDSAIVAVLETPGS
jgi:hypothetical protein